MVANSQTDNRKPRLNPFAFPSDTDFRFVTLIVGVLGTSLFIYSLLYEAIPINAVALNGMYQKCQVAAQTAFPGSSFLDKQEANTLFIQCMLPIQWNATAWICLGLALLLSVTVALYWVLPNWKIWRGGLKVLDAGNAPTGMLAYLSDLCREAGLTRNPVFLLNPYSSASSGLTFGRFRRYFIVLNSGLVIQFHTDRPAFRAIVLHELGHIRNADIDKTYLTITVGWGFAIAALVPWVITQCIPPWHFNQTLNIGWRVLVLSILIYLTRNAILRTREVYADVRASVWDDHGIQKGQISALSRVLKTFPSSGRAHWRYLLRKHPDPQQRYQALSDTSMLFRMGFWDAFAVGVVVTAAISSLSFLLGLLPIVVSIGPITEEVGTIAFALFAALMMASIVGSGIWRATFAGLIGGMALPRAIQASMALLLGLLLGQVLSIQVFSPLSKISFYNDGLPFLLPEQFTLSSFIDQAGFFLVWNVLLLVILFLALRWIRASATTWLDVAVSNSSPGWIYWIAVVIASVVLGTWFEQLTAVQGITQVVLNPSDPLHSAILDAMQTALGVSFPDIRISVLLFDLIALAIDPLICLTFISLWAYPLASWFWRRRKSRTVHATWVWLDASPKAQTLATPYQVPIRPGFAFIMGLAGGLAFCGLLPLFANGLNLALSSDQMIVLAVLLQAGIGAIVAGRVKRIGVIHGLFAAFLAGCMMAAGIVGFSLLHKVQLQFSTIWGIFGQVVNGGALATLLVTLVVAALAVEVRRLSRPATPMRMA